MKAVGLEIPHELEQRLPRVVLEMGMIAAHDADELVELRSEPAQN
jgi:hypothetical protein